MTPSQPARHWLNLPSSDPYGRVFIEDGRVFRDIYPDKTAAVEKIIADPHVGALMADGLMPKMWIESRPAGGGLVIEAERAAFNVPGDRFVRSCLQAATERWIEIALRLGNAGLCLTDAHFGNFMLYGRNEPRWVDLGAIRALPETMEKPFPAFIDLWVQMLAPLLLLRRGGQWERLARLVIADAPDQGPRVTANELPLRLDAFVTEELNELRRSIGAAAGHDALAGTYEFVCTHALKAPVPATHPVPPAIAPHRLTSLLDDADARSVACLGGDVFAGIANILTPYDVVVIDDVEERLEQATAVLAARKVSIVALYLQHVVNRIFLRNPVRADVVLAADPFNRFQHNSAVAADNIAEILAVLAMKLAIISVPQETADTVQPSLRRAFAEVTVTQGESGQAVVICRSVHAG